MLLFHFAVTTTIVGTVASANFIDHSKNSNSDEGIYFSGLMKYAHPTANSIAGRALEGEMEVQVDQVEIGKSPSFDLSAFSIRFDHCRYVESDTLEDIGMVPTMTQRSVPALSKNFAIFRLCPSDSCDSCESNYQEYIIDLESYLQESVAYQLNRQENMCNACTKCTFEKGDDWMEDNADDGNNWIQNTAGRLDNVSIDCESCYDECTMIENMEENGYLDATNFIQCQMIYDPEDDALSSLYAGPMCASDGSKIKIGVFTDEYCKESAMHAAVEDYIVNGDGYSMKLSHSLLKTTYSNDCISCNLEGEAHDICNQLYNSAERFVDADVSDSNVNSSTTDTDMGSFLSSGYAKTSERNKFEVAVFGIAPVIMTLLVD